MWSVSALTAAIVAIQWPLLAFAIPHNERRTDVCNSGIYGELTPLVKELPIAQAFCNALFPPKCAPAKIEQRVVEIEARSKATSITSSRTAPASTKTTMQDKYSSAWSKCQKQPYSVISTICYCIETHKPCATTSVKTSSKSTSSTSAWTTTTSRTTTSTSSTTSRTTSSMTSSSTSSTTATTTSSSSSTTSTTASSTSSTTSSSTTTTSTTSTDTTTSSTSSSTTTTTDSTTSSSTTTSTTGEPSPTCTPFCSNPQSYAPASYNFLFETCALYDDSFGDQITGYTFYPATLSDCDAIDQCGQDAVTNKAPSFRVFPGLTVSGRPVWFCDFGQHTYDPSSRNEEVDPNGGNAYTFSQ